MNERHAGIATAAGAQRTGIPEGTRVLYTLDNSNSGIARTVYDLQGNRLCGIVSTTGEDRGIDPEQVYTA
jgi:hypothetical protein